MDADNATSSVAWDLIVISVGLSAYIVNTIRVAWCSFSRDSGFITTVRYK